MLTTAAVVLAFMCFFFGEESEAPQVHVLLKTIDENFAELRKWIVILEVAYLVLVAVLCWKRRRTVPKYVDDESQEELES